ncbi:hypothetical protein HDU93_000005 [Gonapodya sp. JEL0774]|nr:hypothetical protein HDU93_000005 [Gonapodya sp. JEL0774]
MFVRIPSEMKLEANMDLFVELLPAPSETDIPIDLHMSHEDEPQLGSSPVELSSDDVPSSPPVVAPPAPKLRVLILAREDPPWLTQFREDIVAEHLNMVKDIAVLTVKDENDSKGLRDYLEEETTLTDVLVIAEAEAVSNYKDAVALPAQTLRVGKLAQCRTALFALPSLRSPLAGVVFVADSLDGAKSELPSREDILRASVCRPLVVLSESSSVGHWRHVSNVWQSNFSVDAIIVPSGDASATVDANFLVPELIVYVESAWISEHLTRAVPLVTEAPIRFRPAFKPEITEAKPLKLVNGKWVDEWESEEEDDDEDDEEDPQDPDRKEYSQGTAHSPGEKERHTKDVAVEQQPQSDAPNDTVTTPVLVSEDQRPRTRDQSPNERKSRSSRPNPPRTAEITATFAEDEEVRGRAARLVDNLDDVKIGVGLEQTFENLDLGLDLKF